MDKQSQIMDLPEPQGRILSQGEQTLREWRLFVIFTQFVTFYACIHKLFIPLFLSFTALKHSPYAEIQFSLVLQLLIAMTTFRSTHHTPWLSFLCGAAILFGLDELYLALVGRYTGWFAFSKLLSSIPMSIACGFSMSKRSFEPKYGMAWLGVGLLGFGILTREMVGLFKTTPTPEVKLSSSKYLPTSDIHNIECAAQILKINREDSPKSQAASISVSNCGLTPSIYTFSKGRLSIENTTGEAINLHLIIYEGGKKKTGWNTLVRAQEKILSSKFELNENSIGLLYSDSKPNFGIIALRPATLNYTWVVSRKPIEAKAISQGDKP